MKRQEFVDECLREHNKYRLLHGVSELKYSTDLDASSQGWADVLVHKDHLSNSPTADSGDVGENIATRSGSGKKITLSGADVSKQWYDDICKYDFALNEGRAGNFTQLIWKSTEEVGFGIGHVKGKCVVVAHYRPAGNVYGHYANNVFPLASCDGNKDDPSACVVVDKVCLMIEAEANIHCPGDYIEMVKCSDELSFKIGDCIQCPGLNIGNEQWSEELCLYKTPTYHSRTESMSSDECFEQGLYGYLEIHQAQRRLLRQFIRETVNEVNKYRNRHGVPILKHNKDLDELSQKWAEELTTRQSMSNSGNTFNDKKVGENVASRWSNMKCDYKAQELVEHWYAESTKYVYDQEPSTIQGVGNFTQMLWKSTKEIGIGKAFASKNNDFQVVIVCSFYPAGNVLHRFMENVLPELQS